MVLLDMKTISGRKQLETKNNEKTIYGPLEIRGII
jgi:hypothetical protein